MSSQITQKINIDKYENNDTTTSFVDNIRKNNTISINGTFSSAASNSGLPLSDKTSASDIIDTSGLQIQCSESPHTKHSDANIADANIASLDSGTPSQKCNAPDYVITYSSSTLSHFNILEIDPNGKFIRLYNSQMKEMDIGNYILQQNCNGQPIVVFRFPPHAKFPSNSVLTVWATSIKSDMICVSTLYYLFNNQPHWATGSDVITILCIPNGKAIAWTNPFLKSPVRNIGLDKMENASDFVESQIAEPEPPKEETKRRPKKPIEKDTSNIRQPKKKPIWKVNHIKFPYGFPPGHECHPCSNLKRLDATKLIPSTFRNSSIFTLVSKYRIKNTAVESHFREAEVPTKQSDED